MPEEKVSMPRGGPRLRGENGELNMVGARVREKRESLGLTRDQLAARLAAETNGAWNPSVDETYNLEAKIRTVTDYELVILAKVLNTTVTWLMDLE
ncbi:MAG: helix-turn-helix transcriptional regulator [Armatimonas sp.]